MTATPYEVKDAIVDVLDDQLNLGVRNPDERVDVFYGWKEADSSNPFVVVGTVDTEYDAQRMSARSTLRRYDITYNVNIDIVAGLHFRTERDADRAAYRLLDRVLTPLVRGDDVGRTLLMDRVAGIQQVEPAGDTMTVAPDEPARKYSVLTLRLAVTVLRN